MSLSNLSHILNVFSGGEPTPEEQQAIVDETVMLVLSRATDSDTNIKPIEIDTVRAIVKKATGQAVSSKDVRMAAHSKIYEAAPLERYLARVSRRIEIQSRVMIARSLAEVILSDDRITGREVRFFNMVSGALDLTPASLAGLFTTH